MNDTCVVDFDETLLTVDSTTYLIFGERLYTNPFILFFGLLFLFVRTLFPRSWQIGIRRHAKYRVLKALHRSGEKRIVDAYSEKFAQLLNKSLLHTIQNQYKHVYVISSAWRPIIQATLAKAGISNFNIIATEFTEDFANFSTCWHEEKAKKIQALRLAPFDFYTDSYDDAPLMRLAANVIMV